MNRLIMDKNIRNVNALRSWGVVTYRGAES